MMCETLAEKHFFQLCAVQRLLPEKNHLKQLIWSFVRAPETMVLLSFHPLENAPFSSSNQTEHVLFNVRVTVQAVSLQNARTVQKFHADMSFSQFLWLRFSMRGPNIVARHEYALWSRKLLYSFADDADSSAGMKSVAPCWIVAKRKRDFQVNGPASKFTHWISGSEEQKADGDWISFAAYAQGYLPVASL
jgi:hypothetical protein